ncbi:Paf1 complex component [Geranomyces variabilis]|uniref:Paf1 complex component n=1 Tax=Geranomyces variabilis TaxID=109894 RepID=A0AAD5TL11_9FUNG|nr:Paf1 complex component [Geranomyces variabilis]
MSENNDTNNTNENLFGSDPSSDDDSDNNARRTTSKPRQAARRAQFSDDSDDDGSGNEQRKPEPAYDSTDDLPSQNLRGDDADADDDSARAANDNSRSPSRDAVSASAANSRAESVGDRDDDGEDAAAIHAENDLFGGYGSSDEERLPRPIAPKPPRRERPVIKQRLVVPNIPRFSQGSDEIFVTRLPNWMGVDHRPFDEDHWDASDEIPADPTIGAHITLENTIRWRTVRDANGQERRESNTRFVKWSDGSTSLILGGEVFDATYTLAAQHQYIVAQVPEAGVFQTQNATPRNMTFKPQSSRTSAVHRKIKAHQATIQNTAFQTKLIVTMNDPEKQREKIEKAELENMRARRRMDAKRRNKSSGSRKLNAQDLDGDSDDDAITYARGNTNIRRALDTYEKDFVDDDEEDDNFDDDDDDDEDDEEEERRERERRDRIMRAKRQSEDTKHSRRKAETSPPPRPSSPPSDAMDVDGAAPAGESKKKKNVVVEDDDGDKIEVKRVKKKRHIVSSSEEDE